MKKVKINACIYALINASLCCLSYRWITSRWTDGDWNDDRRTCGYCKTVTVETEWQKHFYYLNIIQSSNNRCLTNTGTSDFQN